MRENTETLRPQTAADIPLLVQAPQGNELFRVTKEGKFVWGDGLDIDETARLLAETINLYLTGPRVLT